MDIVGNIKITATKFLYFLCNVTTYFRFYMTVSVVIQRLFILLQLSIYGFDYVSETYPLGNKPLTQTFIS